MRHEIILAPGAVEDLKRLRVRERVAVKDGIEVHEPEKVSRSRIKRLRGVQKPQYRLRIDDVRVFYDVGTDRVEVLAIIEKTNAPEWLEKEGKKK